jgi:hypothetical protein
VRERGHPGNTRDLQLRHDCQFPEKPTSGSDPGQHDDSCLKETLDTRKKFHMAKEFSHSGVNLAVRFLCSIILAVCAAVGCTSRQLQPPTDVVNPAAANPADWGPAFQQGMEFGPPSLHLSRAFERAEIFLAKQPFASRYAKRACSGGGERFVDASFALLSDTSGQTFGTVRVDTDSGHCVWLGDTQR